MTYASFRFEDVGEELDLTARFIAGKKRWTDQTLPRYRTPPPFASAAWQWWEVLRPGLAGALPLNVRCVTFNHLPDRCARIPARHAGAVFFPYIMKR
jgi:hypothetical protein